MHRFYCPHADLASSTVSISAPDEIHHLKNVLRLKKNSLVRIFNNNGEGEYKILSVTTKEVRAEKISFMINSPSRTPEVILACAVPRKSKFETIIEKATELGVSEIVPLVTHRTIIQLKGERVFKKTVRYQSVAINASKQSGRIKIPLIHPLTPFKIAVEQLADSTAALIPSLEKERASLYAGLGHLNAPQKISVFIGPEGDFTPEEYRLASQAGLIPVSLGTNILKVETAAIATIAGIKLFFDARSSS